MRAGAQNPGDDTSPLKSAMSWLRARPRLSLWASLLGLAVITAADFVVPGYAISGAYLLLVTFAAIASPLRAAIPIAIAGLVLTLGAMIAHGHLDTESLLLVWFGALAGAGILALVSLYNSVESLYEGQKARLERGALLMRLVDALEPLDDPLAVEETAVRLLAERFDGPRVAFYEMDESGRLTERCKDERRGGASAPLDLQQFLTTLAAGTGKVLVLAEPPGDGAAPDQLGAPRAAGPRHCLAAPLHEDGALVAAIAACDASSRAWSEEEAELLEESATRIWTEVRRARSAAALVLHAHLLDNVHDAVCALDTDHRVTYWNDAATELFGWTREEVLGRTSRELLEASVPGADWAQASARLRRAGSVREEVRYRHKDGHDFWADVRTSVISTEAGDVEGYIATFTDVSAQKQAQEALALEAARLRAIVEAAPVGLGIVAPDGESVLRNDILRKIWSGEAPVHSVEEFQAYTAYWPETGERLRPEDWPAAQVLKGGGPFADVVVDIERFDGSKGTIVLSTAPIVDEGRILGAVTIVQDITRMREAEQALRFLTEEVRSLHETVVLDPSLSSIKLAASVVARAGLLLGSDGSSIFLLEGGSLRRVAGVGLPDPADLGDLVAEAIGDRSVVVRRLPTPSRDAAEMSGGVLLAVPLVLRGEVFGALAFTYEQRRSLDDHQLRVARAFADQAALAIENARLRAKIEETAIEAERTRLARDLHDSVTQSLFAASLKAEALADLVGGDHERTLKAIDELRRLTRGALAGMRTMLIEMRADGLTETPLPELLRHLVEASGSRVGADVSLKVRGQRALPAEVRTAFYRIAQEALNNVARHAKASRVWVDLRLGEEDSRLEIGDDGRGFERGAAAAAAGHYGLRNMRERAEAIGARFEVAGGSGRGTVVVVEWPQGEGGTP